MAHRVILQVALTGARVLGRSFAEAYRQAQASSKYAASASTSSSSSSPGSSSSSSARSTFATGMTLEEAIKILNVKKTAKPADTDMVEVTERYKRLFDANDPKNGGSFYLQSKVVRARERIEAEVGPYMEQKAADEEVKEGLPKMYKDP